MQAFSNVQRAARIDVDDAGDDNAGDDNSSDSAPEVCYLFILFPVFPTHYIGFIYQGTPQKNKKRQKEGACKRMPQVTYKTVSNLWPQ
jgi:hypothetical protein